MDKLAELEKELLADMEENPVEYKETVSNVFEIDSNLRTINIPVTVKNIGVESDDDVKRLEFTMPKQYGEFDLSQFRIRINYANANGDKSIYLVEDKKVSGDNITFSWLVGRNVTKYKGQVNFIICLKLSDEKGKILKELNTTLCRLEVLEGLEVVPVVDEETIDTIEQLLNIVEKRTTEAVKQVQAEGTKQTKSVTAEGIKQTENITAEGTKQVQAVQNAAQKIIADREQIQENKTAITALTQSKADAIINTATGEHIAVGDSSGHLLDNLKIYGKSVQNGTPTPDNPVPIVSTGDKGRVNISIHGKQLFDASKLPTKSAGGATVTNNGDGSFTISGSGKLTNHFQLHYQYTHEETIKILKAGDLHVIQQVATTPYFEITLRSDLGNKYIRNGTTQLTDELLNHASTYLDLIFYAEANDKTIIKPGTIKPMLYQDGDGTWEPFTSLQSLSIPTPNGLLGIPTESGGNYTDQNGQQWICDKIDLKRGKKISCIKQLTLNGTEKWRLESINNNGIANFGTEILGENKSGNKKLFSTHFKKQDTVINETVEEGFFISYNETLYFRVKQERVSTVDGFKSWLSENPVKIIYDLKTPIETDLSPETIEAYKALHTNYPSTVIQNDSEAGMELSYVADTKNYTDQKIKEAVSAQTQNLANLLSLMPLSTQAAMIEADTNNILDNMEVKE